MRKFEVNKRIKAVCESKSTKRGFKHEAKLYVDGNHVDTKSVHYLNRSWESYEFQDALLNLFSKTKALNPDEREFCMAYARENHADMSMFRSVALIAGLGDVLCQGKKSKNDWKKRMIEAGFGNAGLQIPHDWDELSEDEKEQRLNKTIEFMRKGVSSE